jgi:hypothetical protein
MGQSPLSGDPVKEARRAAERLIRTARSYERDRLAEQWLTARHSPGWYIGNATAAEWDMAYVAADGQLTCRGRTES